MRVKWIVLAVALAGCAAQTMNGLVGSDIAQAVASYGPPVNSFDMPDGSKAFQWRFDKTVAMPTYTTATGYSSGSAYGVGNSVNYSGTGSASATTTGGGFFEKHCFYTLYARPNANRSYTVTGFEPPKVGCL